MGYSLKWLRATMRILCGGRIAEERAMGDVSSGASQSSAAAITARVVAATDFELGGSVPKVRLLEAITAGVAAELAMMILRRAPDCRAAYLV
jgi:hypothetical protein